MRNATRGAFARHCLVPEGANHRAGSKPVFVPAEALLDIKPWGNKLGVRIPAAVAQEAKPRANQHAKLAVVSGHVIIKPQADKALTLADRLALFDPALHGGEVMAATPVGAERR